jgi:hypothetical protein
MRNEERLVGLDMIRQTQATMMLKVAINRWDDAEEVAVDLLALQGGRDAHLSRLTLCAASLAQRDLKEARPRLALLKDDDIEAVRLKWVAAVLNPSTKLSPEVRSMLSIDPITRKNIAMLRELKEARVVADRQRLKQPTDRRIFLSQLARMRLAGQSERALTLLELAMKEMQEEWVHGTIVQSLLNYDAGRMMTAVDLAEKLQKCHSRNPHLRSVLHHYADMGHTTSPPSEQSKIEWAFEQDLDWREKWSGHNVSVPPHMKTTDLKKHAWRANAWVGLASEKGLAALLKGKRQHQNLPEDLPLCIYTHLAGLMVTIGGMPVDLGVPGTIQLDDIEAANLLDL